MTIISTIIYSLQPRHDLVDTSAQAIQYAKYDS